jgi:hypothetical protein
VVRRRPARHLQLTDLVWYAAYGSNTDAERFACYLAGGTPPGGAFRNPGARDPSPPRDDRPHVLDLPLRFAGRTRGWLGGGAAFVDPVPVPGTRTLARAWLVTREQLDDVFAQEGDWYDLLLPCGEVDGRPAFTITASRRPAPDPNPPSSAYLSVLVRGLSVTHGLAAEDVATLLSNT